MADETKTGPDAASLMAVVEAKNAQIAALQAKVDLLLGELEKAKQGGGDVDLQLADTRAALATMNAAATRRAMQLTEAEAKIAALQDT